MNRDTEKKGYSMSDTPSLGRFFIPVRVRFADTDLQGHVFFGNYFTYMDEAFMAYIEELGFAWKKLAEMGLGIYYVDSGCQFKGPSFFGERLNVHAWISHTGSSSLTAEMTVVRDNEKEVVASGYIMGVVVNTRTEKSSPIPETLREAITKYQDV
jgi:acyl-CoA thioester hydrolase